jgi:hypothetical protein
MRANACEDTRSRACALARNSELTRACAVRKSAHSVLCAAFALGNAISKVCPPGFFRLDDADWCKMAATLASKMYAGNVSTSFYAAGCYWHPFTDKVYYNAYIGNIEAETLAQPLCAGATGMPAHVRAYARAAPGREGKHTSRQARAQARVWARRRAPFHTPISTRPRAQTDIRVGVPCRAAGRDRASHSRAHMGSFGDGN